MLVSQEFKKKKSLRTHCQSSLKFLIPNKMLFWLALSLASLLKFSTFKTHNFCKNQSVQFGSASLWVASINRQQNLSDTVKALYIKLNVKMWGSAEFLCPWPCRLTVGKSVFYSCEDRSWNKTQHCSNILNLSHYNDISKTHYIIAWIKLLNRVLLTAEISNTLNEKFPKLPCLHLLQKYFMQITLLNRLMYANIQSNPTAMLIQLVVCILASLFKLWFRQLPVQTSNCDVRLWEGLTKQLMCIPSLGCFRFAYKLLSKDTRMVTKVDTPLFATNTKPLQLYQGGNLSL